jgi:hypothetical protein
MGLRLGAKTLALSCFNLSPAHLRVPLAYAARLEILVMTKHWCECAGATLAIAAVFGIMGVGSEHTEVNR